MLLGLLELMSLEHRAPGRSVQGHWCCGSISSRLCKLDCAQESGGCYRQDYVTYMYVHAHTHNRTKDPLRDCLDTYQQAASTLLW